MAKRNLGQVGFRDRGDYSDDDTYKKWDMVTFEGSSYADRKSTRLNSSH